MKMLSAVLALALGVASSTAFAQPGRDEAVTRYTFDDDIVPGDLPVSDGQVLIVRDRAQRSSLIRIREHFVAEMLKTVERL